MTALLASVSKTRKRGGAAALSSFLLLTLLLTGPPLGSRGIDDSPSTDACTNPSIFFAFGILGAAHAFAPQSIISSPERAAGGGGGPTSRHPQRHRYRHRLQMAKLGKIPEYSLDISNGEGATPVSSGGGAGGTAQREVRQLRSDISKTDARLQKLRKESAKMDASRAASSASSSGSASAASAIGTAFRTLLTPVAALGAGRSYLQQRNEVQEEIARTEAELQAKKESLERVEKFTGPSLAAGTVALGAALIGIPAVLDLSSGPTTTSSPSSSLGIKVIDMPKRAKSPKTLAEEEAKTVAMKQQEQKEVQAREEKERIIAVEKSRKAEAERFEQERIAAERKAEAERFEQERIAAERKAEAERFEQERIAAERKAEAERFEQERIVAERKAEAERFEQERIAAERKAEAERFEQERIAAERKAEAARIETERIEQERIAVAKKAEAARIETERIEQERIAAAKKAEAVRIEADRIEQERITAERRAEAARIETERVEQERAAAINALTANVEQQRIEADQSSDGMISPASRFDLNAEKEAAKRALALFAEQKQQNMGDSLSNTLLRPGDVKVDISKFAVPGVAVLSAAIGTLAVIAKKNSADAFSPAATNATTINATAMSMGAEGNVSSSFVAPSTRSSPALSRSDSLRSNTEEKKSPFGSSTGFPSSGFASPSTPPPPNPVMPIPTEANLSNWRPSASKADINQASAKPSFASISNPDDAQSALSAGGINTKSSDIDPKPKIAPALADTRPSLIDEMDSRIATRGISDSMKKDSVSKAATFDKLGGGSAGIQSFIEKEEESSESDRSGPIILPAAATGKPNAGGDLGKEKELSQQKFTTGGSTTDENAPQSNVSQRNNMGGDANDKSNEQPTPLRAAKSKSSPGPSPALATNPFDRLGSKNVLSPTGSSLPISPKQSKEAPVQKKNPFDQFASPGPPPSVPSGPSLPISPKQNKEVPVQKKNPFDQFASPGPPPSAPAGPSLPISPKQNKEVPVQKKNPFDQFASPGPPPSAPSGPSLPISPKQNKEVPVQKKNPFDQFASPGPPQAPPSGAANPFAKNTGSLTNPFAPKKTTEPKKMTAPPFGSTSPAGTGNPFAKNTGSLTNPFTSKKNGGDDGSKDGENDTTEPKKMTAPPFGSASPAGTGNPFAKNTGSLTNPFTSKKNGGDDGSKDGENDTTEPKKMTASPFGSAPPAGTGNPFAKNTGSLTNPFTSKKNGGDDGSKDGENDTTEPKKMTASPFGSAPPAGTGNPFAKNTGSLTNPSASEPTTASGPNSAGDKPNPRPSPALATNPFDRLGSKNALSPTGSSLPISPKQSKESPVQKKNPFDQFASGPTTAPSDSKKPAINPFDQFVQSQSSVGETSLPSLGQQAVERPNLSIQNEPTLQDNGEFQSKESLRQGDKSSFSPFQDIVKAFSPSEQEVVDEVKRVVNQEEEQAKVKSGEGRSFADSKKEAARIAYSKAEKLNTVEREGMEIGKTISGLTPSKMQQQQEKYVYSAGGSAGPRLSDFSEMYSSSLPREPPNQLQRFASVQQVQTAPRSEPQPTSSLESLQSTRQQYPAGTAAGAKLSDFSQMYQTRNVSKPPMPASTLTQRERANSVAAPEIDGSGRSTRRQREQNNGVDSWERLEMQWKVGERHFASNDRKRLNSPKEFALGQNGFFLQLHLDGQRVAVSLSLDNMISNIRMRNLQIYVYCYDGLEQVVARAVDLELSVGGGEVELIVPSNGSGSLSTGLSSFVFERGDGEIVEATREMLNVQARRDVARVYATFDVAPL